MSMISLAQKTKKLLRPILHRLERSAFAVPLYHIFDFYYLMRYKLLARPSIPEADRKNVEENVTFIFKSFNRQKLAKRVYDSIISYYPAAAVIIADDSAEPLAIPGAHILHLPFNSGLCKGLIAALDEVKTDYVMRLDDDTILTPRSNIHKQLSFLQKHPEVDLSGIQLSAFSKLSAKRYSRIRMNRTLIIPSGTMIDDHLVVYKGPNCFLARTEKLRAVGYDPNIRMIDHHEFFYRAAGVIVSVQDPHSCVLHCHNRFDRAYMRFRSDTAGDAVYIRKKHASAR